MEFSDTIDLTAMDYQKRLHARRRRFTVIATVLSIAFSAAMMILKGNALIPVALIVAIAVCGLTWQFPQTMFFTVLIGACAVETYPLGFADSLTDRIPLFWDVNTVVQTYLNAPNFHAVPISLLELLLCLSGTACLLRGIYFKQLKFEMGTLIVPIGLYVVCVLFALANGLATGGLFNIALFEVRAQIYFFIAYLMAVNSPDGGRRLAAGLLWCTALAIGAKAVLCTFRFLVTLKGVTIPELGIGAHEESFFFNCFEFEYMVLKLADIQPKLRRIMFWLLPFVILANLANERRAATAAFVVSIVPLLALGAIAFPSRRRLIAGMAIVVCAVSSVYFPLFWNGTGTIAQPARAIKSQFSPDPRDASSNEYRDAENANLMCTLRVNPIFGYGYGKEIREDVPMVDLTSVDPLIHYRTHNQILWVWMRVGTVGFIIFWCMVTAIVMQACKLLIDPKADTEARCTALMTVMFILMLMIFGLLDMQISNARNMLFCGLWTGNISVLTAMVRRQPAVGSGNLEPSVPKIQTVRWNMPVKREPAHIS